MMLDIYWMQSVFSEICCSQDAFRVYPTSPIQRVVSRATVHDETLTLVRLIIEMQKITHTQFVEVQRTLQH